MQRFGQIRLLMGTMVCLFLVAAAALAQTSTGVVTGSLIDPSGASVPGAKVTLEHKATGAVREVMSDGRGSFYFGSLTTGRYDLRVTSTGFKSLVRAGLPVTAGETVTLGSLGLELGQTDAAITVEAQGTPLQTQTAERAGVITEKQIDGMYSNSRDLFRLLNLLPGVSGTNSTVGTGVDSYVQGNRINTNNVSLESMPLNNFGNHRGPYISPSMDAIGEMKVLLTNYQAEYGRGGGMTVILSARAGSREFHGMGSYYKRHEMFNAMNFFDNRRGVTMKPRDRMNLYTYNIGGPVTIPKLFNRNRDKMFFFWNQEFWPSRATYTNQITVPTELERRGDFSQSFDTGNRLIPIRDPYNNNLPFPGNVIPAERLNQSGLALLNVQPLPNFFDRNISGGNYNHLVFADSDRPRRRDQLRVDYNYSPNDQIVFNYSGFNNVQKGAVGVATTFSQSNWPQLERRYFAVRRTYGVRYTRIFTPTLINEFNIGYLNLNDGEESSAEAIARIQRSTLGFTAGQWYPELNPLNLIPNATFGGIPNPANVLEGGNGRFPYSQPIYQGSMGNNLTWVRGVHTLKTGFTVDIAGNATQNYLSRFGAFDFSRNVNNPLDTNHPYANAALGVFNNYRESNANPLQHGRMRTVEWFAQDNWKVTSRFTLDYGLRFYWMQPIFDRDNTIAGFVPSRWNASKMPQLLVPALVNGRRVALNRTTGEVLPEVAIGGIAAGSGDPFNGMVATNRDSSLPRSLVRNRGVHYAPRFGFAYDVTGKARTVISGGFGMFYTRPNLPFFTDLGAYPPLVSTPIVYYGEMSQLRNYASSGVIFPQAVGGVDENNKTQNNMNFSLSVKRDIGYATVVEVAYVGNLVRNMIWQRNLNAIPLGTNFQQSSFDPTRPTSLLGSAFLRPIVGYTDINLRESAGSANYHSMQIQANRRFARNLTFGAFYVWSKAMQWSGSNDDGGSMISYLDRRDWYHQLQGFDRTHSIKANWVYDTPQTRWKTGPLNLITNGWQIGGVYILESGTPLGFSFSTADAYDFTGTPSVGARIIATGSPCLPADQRTFDRQFNTDVFVRPPRGHLGYNSFGWIRNNWTNNVDLSIRKQIPIWERVKVEYRCEIANFFNHTQLVNPNTAARFDAAGRQINATFGQLTGALPARNMQMGLRAAF